LGGAKSAIITEDEQIQVETKIVTTPSGPVKGLKLENPQTGKQLYEFKGIPYGKEKSDILRTPFLRLAPVKDRNNCQ
jgi:hypothetical protein